MTKYSKLAQQNPGVEEVEKQKKSNLPVFFWRGLEDYGGKIKGF